MNNSQGFSRRYGTAREDAAAIASECILGGFSEGWSGSLEQQAEVETTLEAFNIVYVDDMRGRWAPRRSR